MNPSMRPISLPPFLGERRRGRSAAAVTSISQARADDLGRGCGTAGDLAADEKTTIELFEKAKGSVVYITTRERVFDPWTRNIFSIPRGTGSGTNEVRHGKETRMDRGLLNRDRCNRA